MRFAKSFLNTSEKLHFLKRSSKLFFRIKKGFSKYENKVDIDRELKESKIKIEEMLSINCSAFVYPGGWYNESIKSLCRKVGYKSARSMDIGFNDPNHLDYFALKTQVWDLWTKAEEANEWVNKAIKEGYCLVECFHLVGDRNPNNYMYFSPLNEVEKHFRYILSRKKEIMVETQTNVIELIRVRNQNYVAH
jgi:hypothetical protein